MQKKRKTFFFQVKHKPKKEEYRNIKKKFMKKNIEKKSFSVYVEIVDFGDVTEKERKC